MNRPRATPSTEAPKRELLFGGDARGEARLAHLDGAVGIAFRGRRYDQIVGPGRDVAKLADGLCGDRDIRVDLHPHLPGQAAKSDLKRVDAFGLIAHRGFLPVRHPPLVSGGVTIRNDWRMGKPSATLRWPARFTRQ